MSDLVVRRAVPADFEAIGTAMVAAYAEFAPSTAYLAKLADAQARADQAELWVCAHQGEVVGSVTLCPPRSPWREIARADEGEFRMLAVAPTARGRGVGAALLTAVLERFRADGVVRIVLSSLEAMTTAHRLYERHGFQRLPERDWSPEPGVNLIAYALDL